MFRCCLLPFWSKRKRDAKDFVIKRHDLFRYLYQYKLKGRIRFQWIPKREMFELIIAISCNNVIWINSVTSLMSRTSMQLRLTCSSQQLKMYFIYMHKLKCLLMLIFDENKFAHKIPVRELKISLFICTHYRITESWKRLDWKGRSKVI